MEGALRAVGAPRVPHRRVLLARRALLHVQAQRGHVPRHAGLPRGEMARKVPQHGLLDLHQVHDRRVPRVPGVGDLRAALEAAGVPLPRLLPDGGLQPLRRRGADADVRRPAHGARQRRLRGEAGGLLLQRLGGARRRRDAGAEAEGVGARGPQARAERVRRRGPAADRRRALVPDPRSRHAPRVPALRRRQARVPRRRVRGRARVGPGPVLGGLLRRRRAEARWLRVLGQHADLQVAQPRGRRARARRVRAQGAEPHHDVPRDGAGLDEPGGPPRAARG
mmetsp:Transcript_1610/g.5367  ORF Transcript_1610/g.5367 Transcript_1610/m.5367 type:complete len:280 (-) Transcript_1610:64-903(-)